MRVIISKILFSFLRLFENPKWIDYIVILIVSVVLILRTGASGVLKLVDSGFSFFLL